MNSDIFSATVTYEWNTGMVCMINSYLTFRTDSHDQLGTVYAFCGIIRNFAIKEQPYDREDLPVDFSYFDVFVNWDLLTVSLKTVESDVTAKWLQWKYKRVLRVMNLGSGRF